MLTSLRIENFAIVKQLELDFENGMTAFTGETGAGKSIMIDAMMLALGSRADASVVRVGEEKCVISAVFQLDPASEPTQWLLDNDIDCSQGEILLRRVLTAEGRSKSYINGQLFPLQKVKELSEMLVHIHGQHQHQTLMQHVTHRQQLDHFAKHDELLVSVQAAYKQCQVIKNELITLQQQENNRDRIHLLQFQINELAALGLQEGEMQCLSEEHQLLHHANDYLHRAQQINHYLNADDSPNIIQMLNQVLQLLAELPEEHKAIKNLFDLTNNALIQCEEALGEVNHFGEQINLDPQRLNTVEERISTLHSTGRKYHIDANHLLSHLLHLQEEMKALQARDSRLALLQEQYEKQEKIYQIAAINLRNSRVAYSKKLAAEISAIIKQLGMPKGHVSIDITPLDKLQPHGLDRVEYKVCTNPGMAPDSLNKIASGGELSRISLAIQMITAQRGATPTLFFDEVDVGIGGATAALVGQLLRQLGQRLQVFCVTHQPQVASSAHHHFVVEKHSDNEQTFSTINPLNPTEKIDEIARMLGGLTITEQTRSHAKELLLTYLN